MTLLLLLDAEQTSVDTSLLDSTIIRYRNQLLELLPPGLAWTRIQTSNLSKLLEVCAAEMARIDLRLSDLGLEVIPSTADEMLPEWESLFGLPDDCIGISGSITERRQNVVTKLNSKKAQSFADFQSIATSLGYGAITITGYKPFKVGLSAVGDPLTNEPWVFAKVIHVGTGPDNTKLTCVFRNHVHAHGWLDFVFT
jgi:uncharacterized protein YmfQ (DUF2313 family)